MRTIKNHQNDITPTQIVQNDKPAEMNILLVHTSNAFFNETNTERINKHIKPNTSKAYSACLSKFM